MDWSNYDYNQRKTRRNHQRDEPRHAQPDSDGPGFAQKQAGDQNGDENGRELPKER